MSEQKDQVADLKREIDVLDQAITEAEAKLAAIAALCDRAEQSRPLYLDVARVRAILADVTPTPAQGIDRVNLNPLASRLAAHDFDADDTEVICQDVAEWLGLDDQGYPEAGSDRVLALLRPADGVWLSRDEVWAVRWLLHYWGADLAPELQSRTPPKRQELHALAARLEAGQ